MSKDNNGNNIEQELPELPDFDELQLTSADIDAKTKSLWLKIYTNACTDRERVAIFVSELSRELKGNMNGHMMHGQLVAKYLEKMAKANDQLLKLADQIQAYRTQTGEIDSDSILDEIQGGE